MKKFLIDLYHAISFFFLMAALITGCMLALWGILSKVTGFTIPPEDTRTVVLTVGGNVAFLSFLCTAVDTLRRKFMVERPVKQIVSAAEKITHGDYSVRIPPLQSLNRTDGLDKVVDCFNQMAQELSGTETLRTDFIANVSHELKTPLAVMQNYGMLLQQPDLPEEERIRYAKTIADASRRLAGLVTNILKLNKLENQQIYPATQDYDLGAQLCACLLAFENVWEEKNIDLDTDIQEDVTVTADPELLSLVWNNLFSNAFKFTEDGGTVSVSLKTEGEKVLVTVGDTGCGISPEVGAHIFEKFYQGDTSHATQGNGLGLALVKRVVDILNGEIGVESELGKGSTFIVTLRRT